MTEKDEQKGCIKMKKETSFLKIPANRIIALLLMDVMSIIVASFLAVYIRFDFAFGRIPQEYLLKFEHLIPYKIKMV